MRIRASFMLVSAFAFGVAACASHTPPAPQTTPVPTPLALVSEAPAQPLPAWFASVSPRGEAKDGAQIRVRFRNDLVPVEALEAPDRQAALAHFRLEPALPGRFILLTPRMVAFEADTPLPHASRLRITVTAGLADRAGHSLASDYAWSFTTEPLTFADLPGADQSDPAQLPAQSRRPSFGVDASDAVDTASLLAHAHLVDPNDAKSTVALTLVPSPSPDPSASPDAAGDASGPATGATGMHYDLMPQSELRGDATYGLVIDPGVAPLGGNLPTSDRYEGKLRTYGPLAFTGAAFDGSEGARFAQGLPNLSFTNDIDPTSAAKAVTLVPAPNTSVPLLRVDDGGRIALDSDALSPRTTYTVTVAGTLRDRFGQSLGNAATATLATGDLSPDIWAPEGLILFPAALNLAIDVQSTNLPDHAFRMGVAVLKPADLIAHDVRADADLQKLLPPSAQWSPEPVRAALNAEAVAELPVRRLLGGATGTLAYGISARTTRTRNDAGNFTWTEPTFLGAVQLTNLGVFSQWFPSEGQVRVARLSDGAPVANAQVQVYASVIESSDRRGASQTPCAAGTTGSDGVWRLSPAIFAPCASTALDDAYAPELLTIVRAGDDWSFTRTSRYPYGYEFGLDGQGWSAGKPNAYGTLFTDRSLYQPGETAKFLGVAYFERNGVLARGRSAGYALVAQAPSGATFSLGRSNLDAYGAFAASFDFSPRAETGNWTIAAKGDDGEELDGSFVVAQFKPPNFKVDLSLDRDLAAAGSSVDASSKSDYLFGAPVDGGTSSVTVTRAREYYSPPGWETFSFGRAWYYPEQEPSVTSDVLQRELPIGSSGVARLAVPVGNDLPYPMRYTVSAQTTDVSRLAVTDTKSFVALPSQTLIGLRADFVATAGAPLRVEAIVTDPRGKALSGTRLHVVLQQRLDASVTQIVEGGEAAHDAVRYVDVASRDVTSADGPLAMSFTAARSGDYRVRANLADAADDSGATDREVWVAGAGAASWLTGGQQTLGVKLDKGTYRPGETATALVQSPYPAADLFFAVVRHGVLFQLTRAVSGAAPEVRFTVTPDMLPNAAVEALLIRRGAPLQGTQGAPAGVTSLARVGFAPFDVAIDSKYVKVGVTPRLATLEPGGRQHVAVRLTDAAGKPVRGEVALAVVNDAILQLSGYRFPDVAKSVYADQPISTRFADNRGDVKLASERRSVEKGFGFGGGVMAGPPGTRVRTKFVPLAYWNPALATGADGSAGVDFTLPDDLTTWRVMVLGLGEGARFGNGEATFVSRKALVTTPVLPQFARPGDRFSAGVAITNVGRGTGDLSVSGTVSGGLTYATGDPRAAATGAPLTGSTQALAFDVLATGTQDAEVGFRTLLGTRSDAFVFPVPIVSDDVLETTVTTGATRTSATVPLDVAPEIRGPLGGLEVTVASTLLADVAQPQAALALQHGPFLTTLAARVAIAADAAALDRTYGRADAVPALARSVATDLEAMRGLALPDNGFAAWPGAAKSELYTTAFAAEQLRAARAAGFAVEPDIARVERFLRRALADPRDAAGCGNDDACVAEARLEALETLGSLGEARNDFLSDILAHQAKFGYYERVELARHLLRLPDWRARGVALRDELFENVSLAARSATVDVRGSFGESAVAGQSQMLGLALESGQPAGDVDRLLVSLLALRHDGRWGCVSDDAEALNALALYVRRSGPPPNFSAEVRLPTNPATSLTQRFEGYRVTSRTFATPLTTLDSGPSVVSVAKRGLGTVHYVVALRYRAPDAAPGVYAGLRIDRIVRPAAAASPVASFGLARPAAPATVVAGRVFDVEDRIVTDHPIDDVLVTDPLPAGLEAVDQTFQTSAPLAPGALSGDNWTIDYQSIYRDRVLSFVHHLDAGSYALHYLVRSVTPGTFAWPGASVELQYAPEEFGRTAAAQLTVTAP